MKIIQSKLLNQFASVTQGFTTKDSGNLAFHVNDNRSKVIQNHQNLALLLEYDVNLLVHMKQIHKTDIKIITECDNFYTPPTCDALITDKKNTPLMVMVADCSPILFYDSQKEVIAVAHAGRAGAFGNIIASTLKSFRENFNSKAEDIFVSVGASIQSCCYEVGEEIVQEAKGLNLEYAIIKRDNSYFLDISAILKRQLQNENILQNNIEFSDECSCCCDDKYFSYRTQKHTGRFAGVISLK